MGQLGGAAAAAACDWELPGAACCCSWRETTSLGRCLCGAAVAATAAGWQAVMGVAVTMLRICRCWLAAVAGPAAVRFGMQEGRAGPPCQALYAGWTDWRGAHL